VFFGEGLPERFFDVWDEDLELLQDAKDGEFLTITAGTSLTVYPFASLPSEVPKTQKRVLVNKERVGDFKNKRENDHVFLDDSDEFIEALCDVLGWRKELDNLVNNAKKEIKGSETLENETSEDKVIDIKEDIKNELDREEKQGKKEVDEITKDLENLDIEKSKNKTTPKSI